MACIYLHSTTQTAFLNHFQKKKNQKGFLWIKISQGTQILCLDHYIGFLNSQKGPENVKKGYKFG